MNKDIHQIENSYRNLVSDQFNNTSLRVDTMIDLAIRLYNEVAIPHDSPLDDMLLFQYGIYDWGDDHGRHFSFDLTRQFFKPNEDEPYQISITLVYDADAFEQCDSISYWSDEYDSLEDFVADIKKAQGYTLARDMAAKSYTYHFGQC